MQGTMTEKRDEIYTVNEIAEILRIAPKTVRKLIAAGEIEAFPIGGYYRITKSALDEFIRRKSKTRENET